MAVGGYGAKVKIYSSGVLTAIADVLDHTIPEEIKHLADSTARPTSGQTGYATHLDTGKRRLGEFSITVSWDAGETTHAALLTAYASTDPVVFLLENADGSDTLWITALVRSIGRIAQQEAGYKCTVNLMPTGDVSYTGAEARIFDFTLAASDSFNRANAGALGDTDGAGIDSVTGGSGLAWIEQVGTWAINNNRAYADSVSGSVAIATVDTSKVNGVVCGSGTAVSGNYWGLVLRYVDSSNFVRAIINSSGNLSLTQVVSGTPTALITRTISFVADAELVVRLDGLRASLEYNGVYYGSAALNAAFASSTLHGMYSSAAASTINLNYWHFVNLPDYENAMQPSIVQVTTGEYLCSVPVRNEEARVAEFDIRQEKTTLSGYSFTSEVRHIFGLNLVTRSSGAAVDLSNGAGWEQAGLIGADADAQGDYGYYGSIHQSEQLDTFAITIEGYSGTLPRWKRVYSRSIMIDQTMTTIYPKDKTTEIGTTTMRHTFYGDKLRVTRSHTHEAGYKIYGWYGAMLPILSADLDRWSIGGSAGTAFVGDDAGKGYMDASKALAYKASGDYTLVMELPSGSADDSGAWTYTGTEYLWVKDNADGAPKFYANYVSNTFANKIAAGASSHTVDYYVQNGIP